MQRIETPAPMRSRWLAGAESILATAEQIGEVLALGERCVASGCLGQARWRGLVATACKDPQTVGTLRDLLATLFLHTAASFPALGDELRAKNEQLADLLRVSG